MEHDGQAIHGTFREQYTKMQALVMDAIDKGAATPDEYRGTMLQVLRGIEAIRGKHEKALSLLKQQIENHNGSIAACSLMSSLVINIVEARVTERLRIIEGMKTIKRRDVEDNKRHLQELREKGLNEQADALEADIAKAELELQLEEAIPEGSEKESAMTAAAVKTAMDETPQFTVPSHPELSSQPTRQRMLNPEGTLISEAVNESLEAEPVNASEVAGQRDRAIAAINATDLAELTKKNSKKKK